MPKGKSSASTASTGREHTVKRTRDLLKKHDKLKPPIELDENELQVFEGFLSTRPEELWTASDLKSLAQLSKISCQLDRAQEVLDEEGFILEDSRGRSYEHPISGVQAKLVSAYRTLSMVLRLSIGNAPSGEKPDIDEKRRDRAEEAARQATRAMVDDSSGLLAGWDEEGTYDQDDQADDEG